MRKCFSLTIFLTLFLSEKLMALSNLGDIQTSSKNNTFDYIRSIHHFLKIDQKQIYQKTKRPEEAIAQNQATSVPWEEVPAASLDYLIDDIPIQEEFEEEKITDATMEEHPESETSHKEQQEFSQQNEKSLRIAGISADLGMELGTNAYQVVLDPRHKTGLYAELAYPVLWVSKKLGDRFEKGEILIRLEDKVPQGNYEKAFAQLDQAFAKFEATSQLYKENLASLFELKDSEAEIAKAKAELTLAEKNFNATRILAPYDGIIDTINIEEHEMPANGKEMMKVIDDEVLVARLLVPSRLLPNIHAGTPFTIHLSETDETIEAKVTRIGGMIDPASSTMKIEADIDNKEKKYKAGMSGIATFPLMSVKKDRH